MSFDFGFPADLESMWLFFLNPVLFELISWVQIWGMFYQVLIQVQTYRELHYIQIFLP